MMQLSAVSRTLAAIKRYGLQPEQFDAAILAAINVCLCLESNGNDYVAEGFNNDILINGRGFAGAAAAMAFCERRGTLSHARKSPLLQGNDPMGLTVSPFSRRTISRSATAVCASNDMRDILRDWRRWSRTERVMAVLIATSLTIGLPLAIAVNFYSTMLSRGGAF